MTMASLGWTAAVGRTETLTLELAAQLGRAACDRLEQTLNSRSGLSSQ